RRTPYLQRRIVETQSRGGVPWWTRIASALTRCSRYRRRDRPPAVAPLAEPGERVAGAQVGVELGQRLADGVAAALGLGEVGADQAHRASSSLMRIARSSQIRARTMSISSAAQTSGSVRGMKHQAPAG